MRFGRQCDRDGAGDSLGDFPLHDQHIAEVALVRFGPNRTLIVDSDELSGDAHALTSPPQAPLQNVIGSELSTDVATTVIAFLEQRTRFLKPVFVGDSVKPVFEVVECEPKSGGRGRVRIKVAVFDEAGETVLEGEHAYLIKARPE